MAYKLINVKDYAKKLKEKYKEHPDLWYKSILPKEAADSFRKKTNDDYSLIWHEHCCECWKTINIYIDDIAYYDEESINWLCKDCYKEKYQKR